MAHRDDPRRLERFDGFGLCWITRHNEEVARRAHRPEGVRRTPPPGRVSSLGAHWRGDGTPKAAYRSQGEALAVADERRNESGLDLIVYRCDFCQAWHLANRTGRGRDEF